MDSLLYEQVLARNSCIGQSLQKPAVVLAAQNNMLDY